ncbi:hypothetical protein HNR23_003397 [Nocardiopsis mwathae]|uniref:Helix-turn-helix domain-containing protein n=1 Tax=Nocardiopsis mwathae TaxID=1472723 RepID=A0A7W9YJJ3_9ACTN|nr:helix-turn-helix domain-containing protein [Nocardiopsis mwathae]MBB6172323.1 hypothetical protein [Nocardiopsis mwathae]MBB6173337.1 hypothetical protein [Nocardiopsis mwathae]
MKRENKQGNDSPGSLDGLWAVDDVAAYLRKPVSWVHDNHRKYFHAARVGRELRFSANEVKKWISGQIRP